MEPLEPIPVPWAYDCATVAADEVVPGLEKSLQWRDFCSAPVIAWHLETVGITRCEPD